MQYFSRRKFMKKIILTILIGLTCICAFDLTACGKEPEHKHDYILSMYNDTKHWQECECGYKQNIEDHSYTMLHNELKHWYECECGDKSAEEEHEGGQATCTELAKCSVCLNEYGTLQAHDYKMLKFDNDNHWYECECGDKSAEEEHEYLNGRCEECDSIDPTYMTEGLKFNLINNDTEYEVSGYTGTSTEVYIPSLYNGKPVTSICDYAFLQNEKITSIEIPNSVTSIGEGAFAYCNSLTSVIIGNNATTINPTIFAASNSLTSIVVTNGNTKYHSKDNCLIETETNTLIVGCKTSIIPNYVTSIGNYAFVSCHSLTNINIPNSVTSIGDSAFNNCFSLTSVTIGNSVTSIGDSAFNYCESLQSINIPASVTSIGEDAFYRCLSLTSIEIPNSVTSIGYMAFYWCNSLNYNIKEGLKYLGNSNNPYLYLAGVVDRKITTATIDNNCGFIGDRAFYGCYSLTSVETPNSVTSIGEWAFYECYSLTSVTIGNSVTSIGDFAFYNCDSLTSIEIPNSVTSICDGAFVDCDSLTYNVKDGLKYLGNSNNPYLYLVGVVDENITTATIDNNCRFIGTEAFESCDSLTSITIGNSVTTIGEDAFSDCESLTSIEIPNSVTSIGDYAFYSCYSLESVTIGNSVTSIGNYAFEDCTSLESIDVAEDNPNYKDIDGNLYTQDGKVLLQYAIGKTATEFIIPNSVTSIDHHAFSWCTSLTSIVLPNSVTSIGAFAFSSCDSLTSIEIPNSVTSIGYNAFSYCYSLTTIYCQAQSKPSGWFNDWKYDCSAEVIWGYKG